MASRLTTDITDDTHISATASSPVGESDGAADLTPLRAHYLKKSLIQMQIKTELDAIVASSPDNASTLSHLGPPFSPPPKGAEPLDLPFLRYVFRQFVLTFPFMAAAPKDFYSEKLQPFVASMLARNLTTTDILDQSVDASEQATRAKMLNKVERSLSTFIGTATKLVEREDVVRLNQNDLDRLETLAKKRMERLAKNKEMFEVNIIGVRTVTDRGRVRNTHHEEFIIRTRRSNFPDIFVSRRYGDFKTLATELRKVHPEQDIPNPPVKDRTTVNVTTSLSSPISSSPSFTSSFNPSTPPLMSRGNAMAYPSDESLQSLGSPSLSGMRSPTSPQQNQSRLSREKNRLTLRAYLHSLMTSKVVVSSPVLRSFLLSGPTHLTTEELEDARRREEADQVREEGRKRFASEIAQRVDGLRDAVRSVKGDIMGENGLTHVFGTIKVTPNVRDLPPNYRAVLEWARISLASTVFHHFIASDSASEAFASLKRIHGLMPYMFMKGALKISNPIGMIRTILDLFLAQPFGGKSLLQRMFTSSLTEEVKDLEEQVEAVKDKVDDPIICEKVRQFVYAPKEIQDLYRLDAAEEQMSLISIILRSGEAPLLNRAQMHRVAKANKAHADYMRRKESLADSDDDTGPQDDDAWLYEDLRILSQIYSRLRDREQLIALVFEGFTAELLKDIITIFYSPLAQVYKAASIADSLSDMQNFINDLIKTVESVEECKLDHTFVVALSLILLLVNQQDPHRTVQTFIDLIERHEQAFYHFVHKVHTKGEGLFDSLMRWIELFLTIVREGLGEPLSLEFLLPHTGEERTQILYEVDKVALHHYRLKLMYEGKLRRRFGRAQNGVGSEPDEEEAAQTLVNGIVGELSFGELAQGDVDDFEGSDESDNDDSSDYETGSDDGTSSGEGSGSTGEEVRHRQPPRSATLALPPVPPPPPEVTTPKMSRPRSLSLKLSRSMSSLRTAGSSMRRSYESPPPPVPPLPMKNPHFAALSKPLPPSPSRSSVSSSDRSVASARYRSSRRSTPITPSAPRPKKKEDKALQPPDLKHIPKLLPIFIELIRPNLRTRQRTNPS